MASCTNEFTVDATQTQLLPTFICTPATMTSEEVFVPSPVDDPREEASVPFPDVPVDNPRGDVVGAVPRKGALPSACYYVLAFCIAVIALGILIPKEVAYIPPSHVMTLTHYPTIGPSTGTLTLVSQNLVRGPGVLHFDATFNNLAFEIVDPVIQVMYYNPNDQRTGAKMVDVVYNLTSRHSLSVGMQNISLQIPFPSENALQMAIDLRAHLLIQVTDSKRGDVLLVETIHLPSAIVFSPWTDHLKGRAIRFMTFGEQGVGKTTILEDLMNLLINLHSRLPFAPPRSGVITDAGTIGVVRMEPLTKEKGSVGSSLIPYDTEGSSRYLP